VRVIPETDLAWIEVRFWSRPCPEGREYIKAQGGIILDHYIVPKNARGAIGQYSVIGDCSLRHKSVYGNTLKLGFRKLSSMWFNVITKATCHYYPVNNEYLIGY
jgi:hypothetical protein